MITTVIVIGVFLVMGFALVIGHYLGGGR